MQYSYDKVILKPFSIQENFRSNRTFQSCACALFDSNNKKMSSQKTFARYRKKCAKIIPFFNNFFFKNFTWKKIALTPLIMESQSTKCDIWRYYHLFEDKYNYNALL